MSSLGTLNFLDMLPGSISTDPTLQAAAGALNASSVVTQEATLEDSN